MLFLIQIDHMRQFHQVDLSFEMMTKQMDIKAEIFNKP